MHAAPLPADAADLEHVPPVAPVWATRLLAVRDRWHTPCLVAAALLTLGVFALDYVAFPAISVAVLYLLPLLLVALASRVWGHGWLVALCLALLCYAGFRPGDGAWPQGHAAAHALWYSVAYLGVFVVVLLLTQGLLRTVRPCRRMPRRWRRSAPTPGP